MGKFEVKVAGISLEIVGLANNRISPAFRDSIVGLIQESAAELHVSTDIETREYNESRVTFYIQCPEHCIKHLCVSVQDKIDVRTEFGPESEAMLVLLERHPELRDHPRFGELVGSFENMVLKAHELLRDKDSKPNQAQRPVVTRTSQPGLAGEELANRREDQLRGLGPGQVPPSIANKDDRGIADIVSTPARRPGEVGNVFGGSNDGRAAGG